MEYDMEELAAVVGRLARRYLNGESTSMTYEKAEQLMGAVLYCMNEAEHAADGDTLTKMGGMTAQELYEAGVRCVEEKAKKTLSLYHELLPDFDDYGNQCLHDTVLKGIPEFFKWYDVRFAPQETILMLDYPLLRDLTEISGVDRIYEFLGCIRLEQRFLHMFPREYVMEIMDRYDGRHRELVENLCEIVLTFLIGHELAGKSGGNGKQAWAAVEEFVRKSCGKTFEAPEPILRYLDGAMDGILARLQYAAESLCFDGGEQNVYL